jgi:hypothetical protein
VDDCLIFALSLTTGEIEGKYHVCNMMGSMSLLTDQSVQFFAQSQEGMWPVIDLISIPQSAVN